MNSDADSISFEDQFAAFNGQAPWEAPAEQPAVLLVPAPQPAPDPVPFEPFAAPAQPVSFDAFTPVPETAPPAVPVAAAAEPTTELLLAELDKAAQTLVAFRQEVDRVVGQQRTTEAELQATRGQLAQIEGQLRDSGDHVRLEGELARQRELMASVRARLVELVSVLDAG